MSIWITYIVLTVLQLCIVDVVALECYECVDSASSTSCITTRICTDNQVCFVQSKPSPSGITFDMGCRGNQECSAQSGVNIIGRSVSAKRQAETCLECCSTDMCNAHLCYHEKPSTCVDDESYDCANIDSLFHICQNIHQAQKVCPKFCNLCNVVDGSWSTWSTWSSCDVTCDNGTQTRSRTCTNPAPAYGGLNCSGAGMENKQCVKELCPVHGGWSLWGPWGSCSATCGAGLERRDRTCSAPYPERFGDNCYGDSRDDRACLETPCADGVWMNWGSWQACSVTCGTGITRRNRKCDNQIPSTYGQVCIGSPEQTDLCNKNACPTYGVWMNWGSWQACSVTCGTGITRRNRKCDNQIPSKYGQVCIGSPEQTDLCNKNACPTYSDCHEIKLRNSTAATGVYTVNPFGPTRPIQVYCDMVTDGGGWTVFQRRFNGSTDFYRNFSEYEFGFGNTHGEFWLGLWYVHIMTLYFNSELRLDLTAADDSTAYEVFKSFSLSASPAYTLHINLGTGTAGDGTTGLSVHNGHDFYTKDHDDQYGCAVLEHGGWWYSDCGYVNLNGDYVTPGTQSHYNGQYGGVIYYQFKRTISLKRTQMMFRKL